MFSGIVESTARLVAVERDRTNIHFTFTCDFAHELSIDQSVAHNGVCLTVVSQTGDQYVVTAMDETLQRSNLGLLQPGDEVNVERSMRTHRARPRGYNSHLQEGGERRWQLYFHLCLRG